MAKSTSSQQRVQLIRDLSKDLNRTRNPSASSRHSQRTASPEHTTSDFDPANEAMESTRPLENQVQQLPELRASAQKYNPSYKRRDEDWEQDFAIDTSAVARAFPDFSQGSSGFEPYDRSDSPSIEIGRGAKKSKGEPIGLDVKEASFDSDAPFSIGGGYQVMYTPPLNSKQPPIGSRQSSRKTETHHRDWLKGNAQPRKASGLRKEIVDPSPPPAKTTDFDSGEGRKTSGETRRSTSTMQPCVRDENDMSRLSEERAPVTNLTARSTRFGNIKAQQNGPHDALPTRFSSAQTLMSSVGPTEQQKQHTQPTMSSANTGTQPTFKIPPMPNMNELLSGVFDNGTPVFTRNGKPSRFVQALQQSTLNDRREDVGEIAMRDDEQAIFLQLQMLRDRCAQLERKDAETSIEMSELKRKNGVLRGENEVRQKQTRRDSALGTSGSDTERGVGQRRLLVEKTRLESTVRSLQTQLDASNRKATTQEAILDQITTERDAAVGQLSVAWCTLEQLKAEIEDLKAENEGLKGRMGQINAIQQNQLQRFGAIRTNVEAPAMQYSGLQNQHGPTARLDNNTKTQRRDTKPTGESVHKDAGTMFDLSAKQDSINDMTRGRQQQLQIDEPQDTEDSVCEAPKSKGKCRSRMGQSPSTKTAANDETSKDLTYLSFVHDDEIARLRQTLEQERLDRKKVEASRRRPTKEDNALTRTALPEAQPQQPKETISRRSSMKDMTTRSALEEYINEPSIHSTKSQAAHNRRHSDTSILSTRSKRGDPDAENMTSAFIVPDITIRSVPGIIEEAQGILNGFANHKAHNCTVCRREIKQGEVHDHTEKAKKSIKIPKPVPVSDRVRERADYEDEPTIRPSQHPGLALAIVLKGLQDELDHLKIKTIKLEAAYEKYGPGVDRRRRKSIHQHIQRIREEIEVKSDQIYSLYDVLEGQKQAGQQMTDEEAEMTMQSIGLDPADLHLRGGADRHPWEIESTGSSEGLPWEGIESTS